MNKQKKTIISALLLCALLLACLAGCGPQGEKPDASAKPGSSAAPGGEDEKTPENSEEPDQPKVLDFSRLDGVGNNILNLISGNDNFSSAFAADDTYIYFGSNSIRENGLWRMKLDGSECESYIPELDSDAKNFNLLDGELYYSIDCYIRAIDLATKEERDLGYYGDDVSKMLVIGERIYFTSVGKSMGVRLWTMPRDGSEQPSRLYKSAEYIGGISELVTDGKTLYLFIAEGRGRSAFMNVYELALDANLDAEMEKRATVNAYDNAAFVPVNGSFFAFGANAFLMAKQYYEDDRWQYEAMFYDDMEGNLRTVETTDLGHFGEEPADGSFYWREMGVPKFVLGNNLFGVYNSKYEPEHMGNTVSAPHLIYMMKDMDVSSPSLVCEYSGRDFVAGGVCGDKLCIIEKDGDSMKLTTIDENGNVG